MGYTRIKEGFGYPAISLNGFEIGFFYYRNERCRVKYQLVLEEFPSEATDRIGDTLEWFTICPILVSYN
jgi:hypothetical protein